MRTSDIGLGLVHDKYVCFLVLLQVQSVFVAHCEDQQIEYG